MAELGITCPSTTTAGGGGGNVNISNRTLIRTGGAVHADTEISFNSPGAGWASTGDLVTFSGASDFVDSTQFFRNGQLLHPGTGAGADNDVYFVSTSSFAFEFTIVPNDIIQIWRFTSASG